MQWKNYRKSTVCSSELVQIFGETAICRFAFESPLLNSISFQFSLRTILSSNLVSLLTPYWKGLQEVAVRFAVELYLMLVLCKRMEFELTV